MAKVLTMKTAGQYVHSLAQKTDIIQLMQVKRWEKEYSKTRALPSSTTMFPSKALVWYFENYIKPKKVSVENALDIGSGQGRNSIFLAQKGYGVVGIEISKFALSVAKKEAKAVEVAEKIKFIEKSAGVKLPFEKESFGLIIDMMVLHLLNAKERTKYSKNINRLLKPNGHFLFNTISSDSPAIEELLKNRPGKESGSYRIPGSGMVEKAFTKKELVELFYPLKLVYFDKQERQTVAAGETYDMIYFTGIMEKS